MEPFTVFTAVAVPVDEANIDTDRIVPARFLKQPHLPGSFAGFAFHDMRRRPDGSLDPGFALNQEAYRSARILVAGRNFGCGSSREGAVWALADAGFRAVVAESFGDIFYGNTRNNGLLAVRLPAQVITALVRDLERSPGASVTIDLPSQVLIAPDGSRHGFEIDPSSKHRLVAGLDHIGVTLEYESSIADFEVGRRRAYPWLFETAPDMEGR